MKKASEYHDHAAECRTLAASAKAEHRVMFLTMAETWESLARNREDQVERQRRLELLSVSPDIKK